MRRALVGPHVQKDRGTGVGQGCVRVAPALGLLQNQPLPRISRATCQNTTEGVRARGGGAAGRGPGSLDKPHIHDRCFAQKNTVKSSCKYNGGLLSHTTGSAGLLFSVLPIWCEEGWGGQVWGLEGGPLSAHPCRPLSSPPQKNSPFLANVTPSPSEPWAGSVP